MRVDFYKNRDKLLKNGKYLLYEDDKIILFQDGILYYWLSRVYASNNPANPIHDEEKSKYWEEKSKEFKK